MSERESNRRVLFTLLDTQWVARSGAWQFPLNFIVLGVVSVLLEAVFRQDLGAGQWLGRGVIIGGMMIMVYILHTVGHIIGARIVDAPMDENHIYRFHQRNYYKQHDVSRRQHLGRALGGPLMNIGVGVGMLAVGAAAASVILLTAGGFSLLLGLLSFLPLPYIDGSIIWNISG